MSTDIAIIGAGVEGCSIAYALASRGAGSITVFERDGVGSGGTGRSAGIVRCHYGVPQVASLALASLPVFRDSVDILGADAEFRPVGYVVGVGPENVEPFTASVSAQQELGINTGLVDAATIAELWPTAYLDDFAAFCYEPEGGYADGYATAQAFATASRRLGVTIKQGAKVASVDVDGGRVRGVTLADGTSVEAGTVILATGPWSRPLLAPLGIDVSVAPICVQEVVIDPGQDLGDPPVFSDIVSKQYVHMRNGEMLFGNSAGEGAEMPIEDPDVFPTHASNEAIEMVAEKAMHRFPGIEDPSVASTSTGVIDVTPDHNPIMSGTDYDGFYLATGFSGHGFKISPAVGQFMADLVTGAESSIPGVGLDDFALSRFEQGRLLLSQFPYAGATGIR